MKWTDDFRHGGRELRKVLQDASDLIQANLPELPVRLPGLAPLVPAVPVPARAPGETGHEVTDFGSNPGKLRMLVHLPARGVRAGAPLIVVLHGCGQEAGSFAAETGWTGFSDRTGAVLVMPEQLHGNNQGRCFNWFRSTSTARGKGEALSIRQMVDTAMRRYRSDPRRVFVVGLSAGGAMAAAMLAAYPDVFTAGAVVAGLPVGCANSVPQALSRMSKAGPDQPQDAWGSRVREAAPANFQGAWPRLSIWHGQADSTVDPANAELLATQWRALQGLPEAPATDEHVGAKIRHRSWDAQGRPAVEVWTIDDMRHGYPIDGALDSEHASRWVLDTGFSATDAIARFWNLV